jgi:D-arabinose 1-dehydrogenase-like Zn-dependent alcohol dehydrogenase
VQQIVAAHRKQAGASLIGSVAETKDVLAFCAKHSIGPDFEIIKIQDIISAYKKVRMATCGFVMSPTWRR